MSDTQRLGVYMHSHTFDLAKSAYLADLDTLPNGPDSFGAWIDAAIAQHADLTPAVRATLERGLDREIRDARGHSRSFVVGLDTVTKMTAAVIADRRSGRVLSRGDFVSEAIRAAAERSRRRFGKPLPKAPARLPNRPPRGTS